MTGPVVQSVCPRHRTTARRRTQRRCRAVKHRSRSPKRSCAAAWVPAWVPETNSSAASEVASAGWTGRPLGGPATCVPETNSWPPQHASQRPTM
jgi:hypothetical protein